MHGHVEDVRIVVTLARRDQFDHLGSEDDPDGGDDAEDDRGEHGDGVGYLPGLPPLLLLEQRGEHRDERGGKGCVGQQGADEAGDLVGDGESPHLRPDAKVADHDDLPDEAEHPGSGGGQHEKGGRGRQTFLCFIAHVRRLC